MIEKNIILNGLNIHFYQSDEVDQYEAVIFLHGWGSKASDLKSIFEKTANFIAVDLPGFGKSQQPSTAWTTSDYADFLKDFMFKLGIVDPIFVGHSFGGSIIIKYCSVYGNVKKIILIGSAGIRKKSSRLFFYKLGAVVFNAIFNLPGLKKLKNGLRRKFYKKIGSEDYLNSGEMGAIFQKVINDDLTEDMRRMTTQAVLIWGENDTETTVSDAKRMHDLMRKSELFVIPGAGHYVFSDNEKEFDKIFFEQLS